MQLRLLFATPEAEFLKVLDAVIASALELVPIQVAMTAVATRQQLFQRVESGEDDVVVLDWALAGPDTPGLVREILQLNSQLRVVALLPETRRQYREQVWNAAACSSIPKEHIDQEWLSSILCVMHRAMAREAKLRAAFATGKQMAVLDANSCCITDATAGG